MEMVLAILLFASHLSAECGTVRYDTGNFAYNLVGVPDTRPGTWGRADAQYSELTFTAIPDGKAVRVLEITGDLTARWTTRGEGRAWPGFGYYTGVLGAVTTLPRSQGSATVNWGASDTLVYVQGDLGLSGVVRIPFKAEFDERVENAVLPFGKLWFKAAKYLDETDLDTHVEITYSVTYCYVGAP